MVGTRNGPRFSAACGALIAAGALALAGHRGASAASLVVPTNQFIPVALTKSLDSATAHVGDTFTFVTTKNETLGTLVVPKGTPGHGRLAVARPADAKHHGQLALQADSLDLPDGDTVWVNSDPGSSPKARLAGKAHIVILPVPIPIGVGPGESGIKAGDLIIDSGATFNVVTIPPRPSPAALVTATPTPIPSTSPPAPSPAPSPS